MKVQGGEDVAQCLDFLLKVLQLYEDSEKRELEVRSPLSVCLVVSLHSVVHLSHLYLLILINPCYLLFIEIFHRN